MHWPAKRFRILFASALILLLIGGFTIVVAQSNQICVCHVENEQTGRGHVIQVDPQALKGHLRHGDVQCIRDCSEVLGNNCNIADGGECSDRSD
jgi:hypothetical protein